MKEMSEDNFYAMCDRFDEASFKCGKYYPTIDEIQKYIEPEVEKNLDFLIWISETAESPKTPEQAEARTYINNLINKHLKITDSED